METQPAATHNQGSLERQFASVAMILAAAATVLGILVLVGWTFHIPFLTQPITGEPAMNAITALVITVLGVLLLTPKTIPTSVRRMIGIVIVVFGAARIMNYLGLPISLNPWPLRSLLGSNSDTSQIAVGSALSFSLLGATVALRTLHIRQARLIEVPILFVLLIGFISTLGYAYEANSLIDLPFFVTVPPLAAVALFALALAFLFERPREGLVGLLVSPTEGGSMVRQLFPLILLLPPLSAWFGLGGIRSGIFDTGTGVAIIILLNVIFFEVIVWHIGDTTAIVDRRKAVAEAALAKSLNTAVEEKAKDDAVLSSIGDGMFTTDANGKIILINESATAMLGVTDREVLGKHFTTLVLFDDKENALPREDRPTQIALSTGKKVTMSLEHTYWYGRKDGTRFPVEQTVTPIKRGGKIEGAISLFRDVTHEFEIDHAKSEFVSLASHQLQTPLTAINWYLELLRENGRLTTKQKHFLDNAASGSKRMAELVNTLLNVSRIDLGTFIIEPQRITVGTVFTSILDEMQPQIVKKHLVVSRKISIPSTFRADPVLLRIVLQNLIGNAVKYTPDRGHIDVRGERTPRGIEFRVTDTGYGIPIGAREKIFEKMFRANNVKTLVPAGDGLGLYITKSIVERSGGTIAFISTEGKGTTFTVAWPAVGMRPKAGIRQLS